MSRKADALEKDDSEKDGEEIVQRCGPEMGLPTGGKEFDLLRKSDERKALLIVLIRRRTAASTEWFAKRLQMGHPCLVSRQLGKVKRD